MHIKNVAQRSPEWHTWRRGGLSASESAIVLGRSPYATPWRLWALKKGKIPPEDLDRSPLIRRGKEKEDPARAEFERRHGGDILLPVCAESDENPRFRASLDGLGTDTGPVELKCPHPTTMRNVLEVGQACEAYNLYWVQVQHQLFVTGESRGYLCFYCDETEGFDSEWVDLSTGVAWREFEIVRDEAFIRNELLPKGQSFLDLLDSNKAPEKDPELDIYVPDGEAYGRWERHARAWLARKRRIDQLRAEVADLEKEQKTDQSELVTLMGEFAHAEACGVRIARFMTTSPVNYKKVVEDRLTLNDDELEGYRGTAKAQIRMTAMKDEQSTEREQRAQIQSQRLEAMAVEPDEYEGVFAW